MRTLSAAVRSNFLVEGLNHARINSCLPRDRGLAFWNSRIFIPFALAKQTPAGLWPDSAPLFEEECDLGDPALVVDFDRPFFGHRSRLRTALAADYGPVDSREVDLAYGAQQGFERDEFHRRLRGVKLLQPHRVFRVFNGHAQPNVWRRQAAAVPAAKISDHEGTALRQHLKCMPVGGFHGVEHGVDKGPGQFFVKKIAHGVDEDAPGLSPIQRLRQAFGPEREVEAVLKGMPGNAAKPLCEALGVTEVAAARYLRAAGDGIPGRVRPFNWELSG